MRNVFVNVAAILPLLAATVAVGGNQMSIPVASILIIGVGMSYLLVMVFPVQWKRKLRGRRDRVWLTGVCSFGPTIIAITISGIVSDGGGARIVAPLLIFSVILSAALVSLVLNNPKK